MSSYQTLLRQKLELMSQNHDPSEQRVVAEIGQVERFFRWFGRAKFLATTHGNTLYLLGYHLWSRKLYQHCLNMPPCMIRDGNIINITAVLRRILRMKKVKRLPLLPRQLCWRLPESSFFLFPFPYKDKVLLNSDRMRDKTLSYYQKDIALPLDSGFASCSSTEGQVTIRFVQKKSVSDKIAICDALGIRLRAVYSSDDSAAGFATLRNTARTRLERRLSTLPEPVRQDCGGWFSPGLELKVIPRLVAVQRQFWMYVLLVACLFALGFSLVNGSGQDPALRPKVQSLRAEVQKTSARAEARVADNRNQGTLEQRYRQLRAVQGEIHQQLLALWKGVPPPHRLERLQWEKAATLVSLRLTTSNLQALEAWLQGFSAGRISRIEEVERGSWRVTLETKLLRKEQP